MLYIYALHILLLHIFSYTVVAQDKWSHKMGSKDNTMQKKKDLHGQLFQAAAGIWLSACVKRWAVLKDELRRFLLQDLEWTG